MFRMLEKEAIKSLENAIKSLGYEIPEEIKVEEPPNSDLGDLATTVSFQLAKQLKKPPMEITKNILDIIEIPEVFKSVEMKGPYINFFINYDEFSKLVLDSINENYGKLEPKYEKIILEHTSANPNGPLHIGHVRNAIIGDSLSRILQSAGYDVETQYYVNDMGRQIAIIVWGFSALEADLITYGLMIKKYNTIFNSEEFRDTFTKIENYLENKNSYSYIPRENVYSTLTEFLNSYTEIQELFKDKGRSSKYLKDNQEYILDCLNLLEKYDDDSIDKKDEVIGKIYFYANEKLRVDENLKNEIGSLLKIYESGEDEKLAGLFKDVVEKCVSGIESTLNDLNIYHDSFVWESKFIRNQAVKEVLDKLSNYTKTNEVLYLPLEDYGIEKELILTRSDGTSLYSTRDLAYHLEKSENSDKVIDILGSDHKLAIDQLSIALKLLEGKPPEVIFYEFITLPEGSMSTRRGVFISVDDLLDEAINRALDEITKRRADLNKEEATKIAEDIGIGAIRYFIAKLSPEKHIVFKWDEALSFERGCASIQYAHARACKLLEKARYDAKNVDLNTVMNDPFEIELIKMISKFTTVIEESSRINRVHPVAQYALDLAGAFNRFYKSVPVIGTNEEAARLTLVDKSRITIKNCLELLGINSPNSM
ncbi:arginine--tRNA ligase [Methanobacterium oryzae]|uniref:arginine--tRNA ligase n=1 Tax=Methanobacterium oryzae TaxID=69540 RepID=UPI003D24FEC2